MPQNIHRFDFDDAGNLRHYINEELRATVPPEAIPDYQETWPDAPGSKTKLAKASK